MSYAYGMRFDDNSNAITVIDEENQTAVTTGYIDGEPVDFGGGGTDLFVIRLTQDHEQFSADKSFNEIQEAYLKKPMVLVDFTVDGDSIYHLYSYEHGDYVSSESFDFTDGFGNMFLIHFDNTVEYQSAG